MRKFWMALATVVALSIGIAWAEGTGAKTGKAMGCGPCCCDSSSCAK
jgi:hypothetical protein